MSIITVDHDKGEIRNVAVMEVGYHVQADEQPPTASLAERFLKAANYTPPGQDESTVPAMMQELTKISATRPDHVDVFLSVFFGGGNREHLDGLHAPFVRLGHPRGADQLRLDLQDTIGVVVGVMRRARLEGRQLRGDVLLLERPPIPDWPDVRAAILAIAADRPESLGISCTWLGDVSGALAVAADVVAQPASSRNGLLGLPSNGAASHPERPTREIGGRRPYRSDLGQRVGQLVYESLVESWIKGGPV